MKNKKLLFIVGIFVLLFASGCGTNNFCNIDSETIKKESIRYVDETARTDYLKETEFLVVSEKFINDWSVATSTPWIEENVETFFTYFHESSEYSKAITKKEKEIKTGCITTKDINNSVGETVIRRNDWIDAIKQGPIELFVVFPVSNLMIFLSNGLGGNVGANILAIIITTFLFRGLMLALTFKSTLQQQKMQALSPQIADIQAKYANINSPDAKTRASQEIMQLYAKNNIKLFSTMFAPFMTAPIFFAMWAAVNETYVLKQGVLFGVNMGKMLSSYLVPGSNFTTGSFLFAGFLFIIYILGHFILMKLPTWRQNRKNKKKNIVMNKKALEMQKQTKMTTNILMIFMIFVTISLPVGMSIYLISSNIFSILQSIAVERVTQNQGRSK